MKEHRNYNPLISVIMSVYNGAETVVEAIESILTQTFNDFEFIIINDGSTDQTKKIIKSFFKKNKRIILVNQNNIGLTKSLNKAVNLSKGNIIARQDADDVSTPDRFMIQHQWLTKNSYDLCCCRTFLENKNRISPKIGFYIPKKILINFKNPFIHGTFMLKKKTLIELGGYDENFKYAQDFKLIHDLYKNKKKIKYLSQALYVSKTPKNSISIKKRNEQKLYSKKLTFI